MLVLVERPKAPFSFPGQKSSDITAVRRGGEEKGGGEGVSDAPTRKTSCSARDPGRLAICLARTAGLLHNGRGEEKEKEGRMRLVLTREGDAFDFPGGEPSGMNSYAF